jgi:hypothetical protein
MSKDCKCGGKCHDKPVPVLTPGQLVYNKKRAKYAIWGAIIQLTVALLFFGCMVLELIHGCAKTALVCYVFTMYALVESMRSMFDYIDLEAINEAR